jgi:hypothetical protein
VFVKCHLNTARIRLLHPALVMLMIEEGERRQERRLLFGARPSPSALFIPLAAVSTHAVCRCHSCAQLFPVGFNEWTWTRLPRVHLH